MRTPCELEMIDNLEVTKDFLGIAMVLNLVVALVIYRVSALRAYIISGTVLMQM